MIEYTDKGAMLSPCEQYRFLLWRGWEKQREQSRRLVFIGLNPSTADGLVDDPTIRRCVGFAKTFNYTGITMLNLFAKRSPHPYDVSRLAAEDRVGFANDAYLLEFAKTAECVVACWGTQPQGWHQSRARDVDHLLLRDLHCLGKTKTGDPRHPLYVKATQSLVLYSQAPSILKQE